MYKASYLEDLKKFKTTASKKGFLTRAKKQCIELINEMELCLGDKHIGWWMGERITQFHIQDVKSELNTIEDLYKTI